MRRRMSAGVLALVTAAGAVLVGVLAPGAADSAEAAPGTAVAAVATPVTTTGQGLTMTVNPTTKLAPSGATVRVTGSGFATTGILYVAVCAAGAAPGDMTGCIGGAIPEANATTGWGEVTANGHPTTAGPVAAKWGRGGSFDLTLVLPDAIGSAVDCVSGPCSLVTRSANNTDRSQDLSVPLTFTPPPTQPPTQPPTTTSSARPSSTPPTTTQQPSTQTIIGAGTTVTADSIQAPSVVAGGTQVIQFSGFDPGETVALTLYSAPTPLPPTVANAVGQVRAVFTIPLDFPATTHLLQARGEKSGTVGVAEFTVTPAVPTASSSVSASASSTASVASSLLSSASAAASSSAVASTQSSTPITSTGESAASSQASATSGAGSATSGRNLWWLWVVLAVIVLAGLAAGFVAWQRSRSDDDDDLPYVVAGAPEPPDPGWDNPTITAAPPGYGPQRTGAQPQSGPTGAAIPLGHEFGLLSGRDHPDGPALLSGGPQHPSDDARTLLNPVRPDPAAPYTTGPGTQQWTPDFTGQSIPPAQPPGGQPPAGPPAPAQPPDPGPGTEQWRPDFGEPDPDDNGPDAGRHRGG